MAFVREFDAKTHSRNCSIRYSRGEKITIRRHGVPAADAGVLSGESARMTHREIVEGMRKHSKRMEPAR